MRTDTLFYQFFLTFPHLVIEINEASSVGLDLIALTVSQESDAITIAQKAYQKSCQQYQTATIPSKVLELIETALVYKLKNLSREEIETIAILFEL